MNMTTHACSRKTQRGFKSEYIKLILDYGTVKRKPGGTFELAITHKQMTEIENEYKRTMNALSKVVGRKAILVDESFASIITMYNI